MGGCHGLTSRRPLEAETSPQDIVDAPLTPLHNRTGTYGGFGCNFAAAVFCIDGLMNVKL